MCICIYKGAREQASESERTREQVSERARERESERAREQESKRAREQERTRARERESRITRQTHDAIYALIATIQERSQYGFASYCCFIDFATAYPSVHRERLGLTLKNYKITGKIWHVLKENSRSVRVRVLHALIDQNDEVDIFCGLPGGSRLSPTLFGICVAELILELRAKFPLFQFPQITSIDDLN